MTISLLRRIWQRIHVESAAAPPKQRLTGFEPLEPRMVLSGFMAFYTPDYFSPPPGDFTHIDRSGAEIARPTVEFGSFSDYNGLSRGLGPIAFESSTANPADGSVGDRLIGGRPFIDLQSDNFSSSPSEAMVVRVVESTPQANFSYSFIPLSPFALDHILADLPPVSTSGYQLTAFTPMTMASTSMRSLTDRDYTPVNAGGAVERHEEAHDYAATHGTPSNASLALVARPAASFVDRGATISPAEAALASQSALSVNSATVQSTDGSRANGQSGAAVDGSLDRQQNGLLELTEAERLNLKRKLAAGAASLEEAARSNTDRGEQYNEGDAQLAYDATRPFDVTAIPNGQLRLAAAGDLADDGLIEILAGDVTTVIASGEANDQAAANRQMAMEPAVATYQAFETIVDGGSPSTDIAADAARLAAAVAMNAQPVVQAE